MKLSGTWGQVVCVGEARREEAREVGRAQV